MKTKKAFHKIRYSLQDFFKYISNYVQNVFFKLVLLFVLNFFLFGLYLENFFEANFIIFLILFAIDLILIKKLLYKRARIAKILVITSIILLSFLLAQNFFNEVFGKVGVESFISRFDKGLSDSLILGGTQNMLKDTTESGKKVMDEASDSIIHSKEDSKNTFAHINRIRKERDISKIRWNDKIYELAKWKAEDMTNKNYFDHVDPSGKCVGSYAKNFALDYPENSFAENIFGYSSPTYFDQDEAVDSWMNSRGHRYNLLFEDHKRGAMACDSKNCVFIGQGNDEWSCVTGEEGHAFWNTADKQPGEK